MEDKRIENGSKRKLVEIAEETARKMQLFCFLKDVRMNYFATKAIERELKPYESQIENIRKFKLDYSN